MVVAFERIKSFFHSYMNSNCCSFTSHVWLFVTPWTAACQASVPLTVSQSLRKFVFIASVMPSSHLILLTPSSPSALSLSQHQGLFQWVICSHQMTKIPELQLHHQSSSEYSGLITFKTDWFDLLAVQGTFRSLLQHWFFGILPSLWYSSHNCMWSLGRP